MLEPIFDDFADKLSKEYPVTKLKIEILWKNIWNLISIQKKPGKAIAVKVDCDTERKLRLILILIDNLINLSITENNSRIVD